ARWTGGRRGSGPGNRAGSSRGRPSRVGHRVAAPAPVIPELPERAAVPGELCDGTGGGRALLQAVVSTSEQQGIWTLQSSTFPENIANLRLQQSCGFRVIRRLQRVA